LKKGRVILSEARGNTNSNYGHDDHTDSLAFFNGREALDATNFIDAINNFTLLIERHPKDPQYRWLRAKAYYGLKAWTLCREDCEKVIELGMAKSSVNQLLEMACQAESEQSERNQVSTKPDLMSLLALRHDYRLRSLFISADQRLAEGDYVGVLNLVALAERLLDSSDSSNDLAFNLGLIRVRGCIGAGQKREALEVIDFYIKHAQIAMREDFVQQFKGLRALLY
jgi:hypothetical protein